MGPGFVYAARRHSTQQVTLLSDPGMTGQPDPYQATLRFCREHEGETGDYQLTIFVRRTTRRNGRLPSSGK